MDFPSKNIFFKKPLSHYLWIGLYFLIIFGIVGGVFKATSEIDYIWRWHKVPSYFLYEEDVSIKADFEGDVTGIEKNEKSITVTVKGENNTKIYKVPSRKGLNVEAGNYIYENDSIYSIKEWKPGLLLQGLWVTLYVSFISTIFGIIIGLVGGIARVSSNPTLKWLSITYIELIRGSPLLVQIFIWYFVLGTMCNTILQANGFEVISGIWYGMGALSTFTGAYVAEIVRSGIESVHKGQMEAARSLGMTYPQSMIYIILPQAIKKILPPLAGQFISLIKDSSLLGIIAIRELTKATREIITTTLQPFELFFVCAILYLILTFSLSMFVQYLEGRMKTSD